MSDTNSVIPPKEKLKLENLAKKIIEIKKDLRLGTTTLTPLNYIEELEKFNASTTYNPQYVYKTPKLPNYSKILDQYKLEVDDLKIPDELKEHILSFLEDQDNLYRTKLTVGTNAFSENAHNLFDWGTDRLDMLLTNTPKVEFKMEIEHFVKDANFIKKEFEKSLKKYGINTFDIRIDSFTPHIINVGYHSISIGSAIRRFECNIERLVVHEIESHALQTENTKLSLTPLSEFTKYGNQHLYGEGLAIYNEVTTRKITPSAFEMYYYRIKAVRLLHKSFRDIYEALKEHIGHKRAFVMTYRVKRGMTDTSLPGGFPKDASYLLGYHEIETLVSEGYPKKLLYATKSPILSTLLYKYGLIDEKKVLTPRF